MGTENKVAIRTQDYEILDSGSVIIQSGQTAEFFIAGLNFKIIFIEEPAQDGVTLSGRIETRLEHQENAADFLGIYLYNQTNAFFASTPNLISVATVENRNLYLKLSIQSINNNYDRILFYSWYLSKNISQPISNSSVTQ